MKKTVISIIAAAIILGGGITATVFLSSSPEAKVSADQSYNLMTQLKTGKYYLKDGTENEYIEVIDENTLRFSGLDYTALVLEINNDFKTFAEDAKKQLISEYDEISKVFNTGIEYRINKYIPAIEFLVAEDEKSPINGMCLSYGDNFNILDFSNKPQMQYIYSE